MPSVIKPKTPFRAVASRCMAALLLVPSVVVSSASAASDNTPEQARIRYEFAPGDITKLCSAAVSKAEHSFSKVAQAPQPLLSFELIKAELENQLAPLAFVKDFSSNAALRREGASCEEAWKRYLVDVMTRQDLYAALKKQGTPSVAAEARLWTKTMQSFEENGLSLSAEQRKRFKDLKQRLAALESQFQANINEGHAAITFRVSDLGGLPESFVKGLKKTGADEVVVPVTAPNSIRITENAQLAATRRRMQSAFENIAAQKNTPLLTEAITLRRQIAELMGLPTWADFKLRNEMAKDARTALSFLEGLKTKLAARNASDLALLLQRKKQDEPAASGLEAWDVRYYANLLKKEKYQLDNEAIRAYFPKDQAVAGLFKVYSDLLGVRFVEVPGAYWADGVRFYQVRDRARDEVLAYFYTDFIPRDGKYGHAAAFPLRQGRQLATGSYLAPVSAILANFTPGEAGKPALLSHDEVEVLFHEFGHIMHISLTRAPYASLAGASVARDFVEAPSQMLENWVYSPDVLTMVSGHYENPQHKLPAALLKSILDAKDFNRGYFYTRQLVFGTFDLLAHTQKEKGTSDITALYKDVHLRLVGLPTVPDSHFPASFGHIMGEYDAGYYGYLWSEVYARDMFTIFEKGGILNPVIGARYRKTILEQGNMQPEAELLREFLGREPSTEAFFRDLGLQS